MKASARPHQHLFCSGSSLGTVERSLAVEKSVGMKVKNRFSKEYVRL